jgi:hypothetical protein
MKESKIHATDRLRREGRWDEASAYRDEHRRRLRTEGQPKAEASEAALEAMIEKFPPLVVEENEDDLVESDADEVDAAILSARFGGQRADLVADVMWTYENLENRRASVMEATSLGAWSMLKWARENRNRFFKQMLPKALAVHQKEAAENAWQTTEDVGMAEIEKMLRELSSPNPSPADANMAAGSNSRSEST